MTSKQTLKQWFSNLKKPTENHFWAWIDSYWHKSEKIPMQNIEGLDNALQDTASSTQINNHFSDNQAHKALFDLKVDKVQGKGLSTEDFTSQHKEKLEGLKNQEDDFSIDFFDNSQMIRRKSNGEYEPYSISLITPQESYEIFPPFLEKHHLEKEITPLIGGNLLNINKDIKTSDFIEKNGVFYPQNRNITVSTSNDDIVININSHDGFVGSYQKAGAGNIVFETSSDKKLIEVDGTNIINGAKGSIATIAVVADEILLRVSNVDFYLNDTLKIKIIPRRGSGQAVELSYTTILNASKEEQAPATEHNFTENTTDDYVLISNKYLFLGHQMLSPCANFEKINNYDDFLKEEDSPYHIEALSYQYEAPFGLYRADNGTLHPIKIHISGLTMFVPH